MLEKQQSAPLVAIVGRPNVGKSTLFNRLVGFRKAIVFDRPGVTRDRNISTISFGQTSFELMDTGGFEFDSKGIQDQVNQQILSGIRQASLILLVLDGSQGATTEDDRLVQEIRSLDKPVLVVANKLDVRAFKTLSNDFHKYGFQNYVAVSSEHGKGFEKLKESIRDLIGKVSSTKPVKSDKAIRIAFIGRPNVGKSSIVNALVDENRTTVSEVAGTTRDSIDIEIEKDGRVFVFVDTAGLRYKRKVQDDVEYFSVKRAFSAIDQADIVFLVLSSEDSLTTQDQKIAAKVIERRKGLCVLVNKWDLQPQGEKKREDFRKELYSVSPFLHFSDVQFVSAKSGSGIDRIPAIAMRTFSRMYQEYTEDDLIQAYRAISSHHQETGNAGYHLQLKGLYVSKGRSRGPIFRIKCNKPHRVSDAYRKYWENALIDFFHLRNVSLKVVFAKDVKKKKP